MSCEIIAALEDGMAMFPVARQDKTRIDFTLCPNLGRRF